MYKVRGQFSSDLTKFFFTSNLCIYTYTINILSWDICTPNRNKKNLIHWRDEIFPSELTKNTKNYLTLDIWPLHSLDIICLWNYTAFPLSKFFTVTCFKIKVRTDFHSTWQKIILPLALTSDPSRGYTHLLCRPYPKVYAAQI